MARRDDAFVHRFEGPEVLEGLLELVQCPLTFEGVVAAMKEAQALGQTAQGFIPELFETPPRFPDPALARKFFQNMLGLWDELSLGRSVEAKPERQEREKKVRPQPPPFFGASGPTEEYLASARRYLKALDRREQDRLQHKFENRQDALLNFLDEQAFSDEAYACARSLLLETFSLLEAGWEKGVAAVSPAQLSAPLQEDSLEELPLALRKLVDEEVGRAESRTPAPWSASEGAALRSRVHQGVWALWQARRQ